MNVCTFGFACAGLVVLVFLPSIGKKIPFLPCTSNSRVHIYVNVCMTVHKVAGEEKPSRHSRRSQISHAEDRSVSLTRELAGVVL